MSVLFTPKKIGNTEIKNRFVRTPTYEGRAKSNGEVSEELITFYRNLARGEIGLIITGYMFIHPLGRAQPFQTGIHTDDMVPGLRSLVDAVHDEGGKIAFELSHAGRQTTKDLIGQTPLGPSSRRRDPSFLVKPVEMTQEQIYGVIDAFGKATLRAVEAGADAIYVHAGGGYLINQFLSPFFNFRKDKWGGSAENQFRLLKEIILEVKKGAKGTPMLVKLNSNDHTPKPGITPPLAKIYAGWLRELGIDCLEIVSGTVTYSHMNCWRGEVPVKEIVRALPHWQKPLAWLLLKSMSGKFDLIEGWNIEDVKKIRPSLNGMSLILVGGLRRVHHMEQVIEKGDADFIGMCRPFLREPCFVRDIREGKTSAAACVSCNRCIGAVMNRLPSRCYHKGLPS